MRKFNKFFSLEYNFKLKESFRQRNRKYLLSFFLECPYFVLFFPLLLIKWFHRKKYSYKIYCKSYTSYPPIWSLLFSCPLLSFTHSYKWLKWQKLLLLMQHSMQEIFSVCHLHLPVSVNKEAMPLQYLLNPK